MAIIILPKNLDELLTLSNSIIKKHSADAGSSPLAHPGLNQLKSIVKKVQPKYKELLELKEKANKLNDEIQLMLGIHRSEKKIMPGTARFIVAMARNKLKEIYRQDLSKLQHWGFEVIVKERKKKKFNDSFTNSTIRLQKEMVSR